MKASRYRGTFPVEYDPSIEKSDHVETQRAQVESDCIVELKDIIEANAASLSDVEKTVILERFALAPEGFRSAHAQDARAGQHDHRCHQGACAADPEQALKKIRHARKMDTWPLANGSWSTEQKHHGACLAIVGHAFFCLRFFGNGRLIRFQPTGGSCHGFPRGNSDVDALLGVN
ncbi:MAG: hypothetical protein R3E58_17415 [Phycisphaerae bacterium]